MHNNILTSLIPIFLVFSIINAQTSTQTFGNVVMFVNETIQYDLTQYIQGNNLTFEINFQVASVNSKWNLLGSEPLSLSQNFTASSFARDDLDNIIPYFSAAFLDVDNNLYSAIFTTPNQAPTMTDNKFVFLPTNLQNSTCYDLQVINNYTVIIDCMYNDDEESQTNYLFTVSLQNGELLGQTETFTLYQTTGANRYLSFWNSTNVPYLYRTTYSTSTSNSNNTIIEIFTLSDVANPIPYWAIDRTFLKTSALSIQGFDVYMGDIFLVDINSSIIYRVTNYL